MAPSHRPARRAACAVLRTALGVTVALHAPAAAAQTGSGTVTFTFTAFSGPIANALEADQNDPTQWSNTGLVNGVTPAATGWRRRSTDPGVPGFVTGDLTFGSPTSEVRLRYARIPAGDPRENVISFTPRPFTNVTPGQDFVLGTLFFQNGQWHGGGDTPARNVPTDLAFTLTTASGDGAAFNRTISGTVSMVVNQLATEPVTLPEQQAEADWV